MLLRHKTAIKKIYGYVVCTHTRVYNTVQRASIQIERGIKTRCEDNFFLSSSFSLPLLLLLLQRQDRLKREKKMEVVLLLLLLCSAQMVPSNRWVWSRVTSFALLDRACIYIAVLLHRLNASPFPSLCALSLPLSFLLVKTIKKFFKC